MQKSRKKQLIEKCGFSISKVVDVPEVDEASLYVGPQDPGGPPHIASNDHLKQLDPWTRSLGDLKKIKTTTQIKKPQQIQKLKNK